jgi:hypothetical protein
MGAACSTYGRVEVHIGFQWGNPKEGDHLKNPGVDGRIIVKAILVKWDRRHGLNRSGSGEGQVVSSCESGNELSGSINCEEFLE